MTKEEYMKQLAIQQTDISATKTVPISEVEDAVSRQAVIDTIDKWVKSESVLIAFPASKVTPLLDSIHKLLSVKPQEPRWIPVSERLPEEFESVLVCYKSQGGMAQAVSERFGTHTGYRWSALAEIKPIAWMPLPQSYKAESEE